MIAGCGQAAPAGTGPAKPAESTKAAAAQPAAPAKKVDFPTKGKSIALWIPNAAGSPVDIAFRHLVPDLEKELGVPVEVTNKPGAGQQLGFTEYVNNVKPDGYTLVTMNLPNPVTLVLNPDRKTTFTRNDFLPLAMDHADPAAAAVAANGPYKTLQDVVNAAKANPGKIKAATTGLLSDDHLEILDVQRATGTQFAIVHFDSTTEREPALIGGKIDVSFGNCASFWPTVKQGQVKLVGIMDKKPWQFAPEVPTFESLGIKSYGASARFVAARAGTPKEVTDILVQAFKKVITTPQHAQRLNDMGLVVSYMDPAQINAYWTEVENTMTPLMKQALAERK